MAAGFVKQYTGGSSSTQTTGTAITITQPAAGNVLIACVAFGSSTAGAHVSSIATTAGTWTLLNNSAQDTTTGTRQEIWIGSGTWTGSSTSVTPTFSASSKWAANVSEWSGLDTVIETDSTNSVVTYADDTTTAGTATVSTTWPNTVPGGNLIIGAMNLAKSAASTDFTSTSGSPTASSALTYKASGATNANNVGMQALYAVVPKGLSNEVLSWSVGAAWTYTWAMVAVRAKARTYDPSASMTGTVSYNRATAIARSAFAVTMTATVVAARVFGFARSSFTATMTATVAFVRALTRLFSPLLKMAGPPPSTDLRSDTFVRADQSGWGTASDTNTWSQVALLSGGTGTPALAISSNAATCTGSTSNDYLGLGAQTGSGDGEALVRLSASDMNAGGSLRVLLRVQDANTWLFCAFDTVSLYIGGKLSGVQATTQVFSTPGQSAPNKYWVRVRAVGSVVWARIWADGASEPSTWTGTATFAGTVPTAAGYVGVGLQGSTTSTVSTVDSFSYIKYPGALQSKAISSVRSGAMSAAPALGKALSLAVAAFAATCTATANLLRAFVFVRSTFAATCTATVALLRSVAKALTSTLTTTVTRTRDVSHTLSSTITQIVAVTRAVGHALATTITAVPALTRTFTFVRSAFASIIHLIPQAVYDSFARANNVSSWGTADDGQTWTSPYALSGTTALAANEGTFTGSTNDQYWTLGTQTWTADGDVLVRWSASAPSGSFYIRVVARSTGSNPTTTDVDGGFFTVGGALIIVSNGSGSAGSNLSWLANTPYWMRMNLAGSTVKLRRWQDGSAEPTTWDLTATSVSNTSAGGVGLYFGLNASGDTISFDHFSFTPSRPVLAIAHPIAATITGTVARTRQIAHAIAATCTATVARTQQIVHTAAAMITGTVARTQAIAHTLAPKLWLGSSFQGYQNSATLTVTGGGASVSGSTAVPTTSGTDYVVKLALSGATASTVWNGLVDRSAFTDISVWYQSPSTSAWTQLDVDIDQATNGAWSSSNITLWFKLQAAIGASPATDANYRLAWGNANPTAQNTWTNIYPFSDDFTGSSLSGTRWTVNNSATVGVASSKVTITNPATNNQAGIYTVPTYANGYAVAAYMQMTQSGGAVASASIYDKMEWGSEGLPAGSTFPLFQLYAQNGGFNYNVYNSGGSLWAGGLASPDDANWHVFTMGLDGTGHGYAALDGAAASGPSTTLMTAARPIQLAVAQNSGVSGGQVVTDWLKVRPFTATEPTSSLGTLQGVVQLAKTTLHALAATITQTVARTRAVAHTIVAACTGTVARTQQIAHTAASTLTATVSLTRAFVFVRSAFAATLTATVSFARAAGKVLSATLLPSPAPAPADTFSRADQSGWGVASGGSSWAHAGTFFAGTGTPALSISANEGLYTGSTNWELYTLGNALATADADVLVRWRASAFTANGPLFVVLRAIDQNNFYGARITNAGFDYYTLFLGGPDFGGMTGAVPATNTWYWTRIRIVGTTLTGRYWADGDTEPSSWLFTRTRTTLPNGGYVGLFFNPGTTGTTVEVDHFSTTTFQSVPARTTAKALLSTLTSVIARTQDIVHAAAATITGIVARTQAITHTAASTVSAAPALGKDLLLALATFTSSLTGVPSLVRTTLKALVASATAAVAFTADLVGGSVQYAQDLAASCAVTVVTAWATAHALAASCSSSVSTAWQTTTERSATISGSPAIGKDLFLALATFASSMTAAGTLLRAMGKALASSCAASVARTQAIVHVASATITAGTALLRQIAHPLSSAITGSTAYTRATQHVYTVTLLPAATLLRMTQRTLSAGLAAGAALARMASPILRASLAASVGLVRQTTQQQMASLIAVAASAQQTLHGLQSTLPLAADLARNIARQLLSQSTATAEFARDIATTLTAEIRQTMTLLLENSLLVLSAALNMGTDLGRDVQSTLASTLAALALLGRGQYQQLASLLGAAANLGRTTLLSSALGALLDLGSALSIGRRQILELAALFAARAQTSLSTAHAVPATMRTAASLLRHNSKRVIAQLLPAPLIGRLVRHGTRATLAGHSTLARVSSVTRQSTLYLTSALQRASLQALAAALPAFSVVQHTAQRIRALGSTLPVLASAQHAVTHGLRSTIGLPAILQRATSAGLEGVLQTIGESTRLRAPIRLALRAWRALGDVVPVRSTRSSVRRSSTVSVPARALDASVRRSTTLVAHRLVREDPTRMIAQPARADLAGLYISPYEENVAFTVDMTAALPENTHVSGVMVMHVQAKWPGQPDDAATLVNGFAAGPGLASDKITLVVGDGQQEEGKLYTVVLLCTLDNNPQTIATIFVEIPCSRGLPA